MQAAPPAMLQRLLPVIDPTAMTAMGQPLAQVLESLPGGR